MSICLPNLRTTSVFKVYYGGTGQTSLTPGSVVIGNGTDAVNCITGSEGQVLTWSEADNSWVAKDPTGGSGNNLSINNIATKVYKKRISNKEILRNGIKKYPIIDWDSESTRGTFRISEYDPNKKQVIIYNDSKKDLFVSVANDENPKIIIDFDNKEDVQKINIEYKYISESIVRTLFDYKYENLTDLYSYHTFSNDTTEEKGLGKNYSLTTCGTSSTLILYLTPDFYSENLNKHNDDNSGSFFITLSSSSGKSAPKIFSLSSSYYYPEYEQAPYTIYTRVSSSQFIDNNFTLHNKVININGFYVDDIGNKTNTPPEDYSYIVYSEEAMTIDGPEAGLSIFGYTLKPTSSEEVTIRITETR